MSRSSSPTRRAATSSGRSSRPSPPRPTARHAQGAGGSRPARGSSAGWPRTARRRGAPLSVLLLDVEDLKGLNESHGEHVGDAALCALARILEQQSRVSDVIARYGGDEFAALLLGSNFADATRYVERLTEMVRTTGFEAHGRQVALPAVACGVASYGLDGT